MSSAAHSVDPAFPGIEPAVLEAYRNAPDNVNAEVLEGALSLTPRPWPRHTKTTTRIAGALGRFHDPDEGEPGGWVVLAEPELHLGSRPDIIDPETRRGYIHTSQGCREAKDGVSRAGELDVPLSAFFEVAPSQ